LTVASTESQHRKPDFIGIGAQRGATTWLFNCLDAHSDVFVPSAKEVHYFDENYQRGWDWYAGHFADASSSQIIGEITPNYLDHHDSAHRIAMDCPAAKLFVVLREPVSRAISSYELLGHRFMESSFEEACQPGRYLVELGLYAKHLKRFYQYFAREQIKILLFDDVVSKPAEVLQELSSYLGVSKLEAPQLTKRVNSAVFPQAQRMVEAAGLTPLIELAKASPLERPLRGFADLVRRRKRSIEVDRQKLQTYFRDDILELEKLIDRDLSSWLV